MNRYASRKFIVAVLGLVGSHWMLFEKLIEASDYKAIVLGCIGLYQVGNVIGKAVTKPVNPL